MPVTRYEKRGGISTWWFPKDFSQSRYGEYCRSGRNSCTLISLILANEISYQAEFCRRADQLPPRAVDIFSGAINDGNAVYHRLEGQVEMLMRDSRNLNIPDALEALKQHHHKKVTFQLKELFFTHLQADPTKRCYPFIVAERLTKIFNIGLKLYSRPMGPLSVRSSTSNGLRSAYMTVRNKKHVVRKHQSRSSTGAAKRTQKRKASQTPDPDAEAAEAAEAAEPPLPALTTRYLFVLMIADSRTTTLVFEVPNNVVAFIDSHNHGHNTGACITQASIRNLNALSFWFVSMLDQIYTSKPELYEISFFSTQEIEEALETSSICLPPTIS